MSMWFNGKLFPCGKDSDREFINSLIIQNYVRQPYVFRGDMKSVHATIIIWVPFELVVVPLLLKENAMMSISMFMLSSLRFGIVETLIKDVLSSNDETLSQSLLSSGAYNSQVIVPLKASSIFFWQILICSDENSINEHRPRGESVRSPQQDSCCKSPSTTIHSRSVNISFGIPLIFIIETDLLFEIRTWTSGGREPSWGLNLLKIQFHFGVCMSGIAKLVETFFFLFQILFLLFSLASILNNIFVLGFSHFICNAHWNARRLRPGENEGEERW